MRIGICSLIVHRVMAICLLTLPLFLTVLALPAVAQTASETQIQFQSRTYAGSEGTMLSVEVTRTVATTGDFVEAAQAFIVVESFGAADAGDISAPAGLLSSSLTLSWGFDELGTRTIPIGLIEDEMLEDDETILLAIDDVSGGATFGSADTASITISDAQSPPQPGVISLVNFYTASESSQTVRIEARRSGGSDGRVTAQYVLGDDNDTADPGVDYAATVPTSGTLEWGDGDEESKFIDVDIVLDTAIEVDEFFTAEIVDTTGGAAIGFEFDAFSLVTITDSPPPADEVRFAVASATVREDVGTFDIVVERNGTGSGAVEVFYNIASGDATLGTDFNGPNNGFGTLRWPNGDTTDRTIPISVELDAISDDMEDFTVRLSTGEGSGNIDLVTPSEMTVTIADVTPVQPGVISFVNFYTVSESSQSVRIEARRSGGSDGRVTAQYVLGDDNDTADPGVDYAVTAPTSGTLEWGDGDDESKFIDVDIVLDTAIEDDEFFTAEIVDTTGGAAIGFEFDAFSSVTITDTPPPADEVRFAVASDTVLENAGSIDIVVQRIGTGAGEIDVDYRMESGTATFLSDFGAANENTGSLSWPNGDMSERIIAVPIILDSEIEGDENFTVELSMEPPVLFTSPRAARAGLANVTLGTPDEMTVTITDVPPEADVVRFVLASDSVLETDGTIDIVAERVGNGVGDVDVSYVLENGTAQRGTDFDIAGGEIAPESFFWPDGDTTDKTLTIAIDEDTLLEGDETFSVQLSLNSDSGNTVLGEPDETVITIGDSTVFMPGQISFDPDSYTVSEADGTVDLIVTRTNGSDGQLSVDYEVSGGTATLGTDHAVAEAQTGSLTWPAGDDEPQTITVDIVSDLLIEPDENFSVELFRSTNTDAGRLSIDTANVTIVDGTSPDSIALADAEVEVAEDAGVISVTVRRTGSGIDAVSVLYSLVDGTADADLDYANTLPTTGTVSWAAGDLEDKSIEIDIVSDDVAEQDETFLVNLAVDPASQTVSLGATAQTMVIISDIAPLVPGVLQFDPVEYSVAEVDGTVELQVTRTDGSDGPASAEYEIVSGTATLGEDMALTEPVTELLEWPAGDDTPRIITVDVATDEEVEDEETFSVLLSDITGAESGAATTAVVNLLDSTAPTPDTVVMADASLTVEENSGSVDVVVQRVGTGIDAVSVAYSVSDDTATSGLDFDSGESPIGIVSWAAGDIEDKIISIDLINDELIEPNETFSIALGPDETSAEVLIGTPSNTIVTIEDTSPALTPDVISLAEAAQSRLESEPTFSVVIVRTGNASGASTVNWTVSPGSASVTTDIDLDPLSGSVSWEEGDTSERVVEIPIVNDLLVEGSETLTFALSQVQGAELGLPQSANLTINDDDEPPEPGTVQFASESVTVDEDAGFVTLDITRTNGNDGPISVVASTLAGSAGTDDFGTTQTVLTWPDGDNETQQLVVPITLDELTDPSESFAVVLSNATPDDGVLGTPSTAIVEINDVFNGDPGTVQFASAALSVDESDGAVTVSVTRTGGSDSTLSVNYSTRAGSATSGDDFETTQGTLTWADGDSAPQSFSVAILADALTEDEELFTIVLSDARPLGNISIGSIDTVEITINDVEPPPEPEPEPSPGIVQFVSETATVDESAGTVSVSVARTGGTGGAVSVRYETVDGSAIAGDDFDPISGRLQWADGEDDVRTLRIAIDVDELVEADEQFEVVLSDVQPQDEVLGTASTVDVTILDDSVASPGVLAFALTTLSVAESDGDVELQVTRTGGSAGAVSVGYSTLARSADEADFQPSSGRLEWADGDTGVRTIQVAVNRDGLLEPEEQFQVVLAQSEPFGDSEQLGIAVATVSITDSTRPGILGFARSDVFVTEQEGSVTLSVSRSGGSDGDVSVDYALIGGSAEIGTDVVGQSGTLNWADLDAEPKTIRVLINPDNINEDTEQFIVALSNAQPLGAAQIDREQVTVNIVDTTLLADNSVPALDSLGELDLIVVSGDDQSGLPGDLLEPMVIEVVDRGASDAVETDVPILWQAIPEGSAELLESARTVSDDDGRTSNRVRILSRGFVRIVATVDVATPTVTISPARNDPPPFPIGQAEAVFTVRSGIGPATGLKGNQASIGNTLDAVCEVLSVRLEQEQAITVEQQDLFETCQQVESRLVNDDGLGEALDRLIPEELFFLGDSVINTTDIQVTNVYARINAIRSGQVDTVDLAGLQFNHFDQSIPGSVFEAAKDELSGGAASADSSLSGSSRLGFFANGSISYGELDGGENQSDAEFQSSGVTLGADYRATDTTLFGFGVGIVENETDFNPDAGSAQISGLNLTLFGAYYEPDKGYIDAVLDFGRNNIDIERRINLPGTPDQFGIGDTTANVRSLTIGAGRDYKYNGWEFGPYGRLSFIDADIDGYSEVSQGSSEGFGSVLSIGAHSVQSRRFAIGGQVSRTVSTTRSVFIPQLRMEAEFESENRKEGIEATFQHDPTQTPFVINGEERDSSYINLGIGSSALFPNGRSGFLFYETQLGNERVTQHWLKLGIRLEF